MRKLLILFFVLSGIFCSAQNIDTAKFNSDWEKLIDYVNSQYVKTYIESQGNTPDYEIYVKNIKPIIENHSIDNPLTYDSLSILLNENSWSKTEEVIVEIIKERKDLEERTISILLDVTCLPEKIVKVLSNKKTELKSEIESKYTVEQVVGKKSNVKQETKKTENMEQIVSYDWIAILLLFFAVIAIVVVFIFWERMIFPRKVSRVVDSQTKSYKEKLIFGEKAKEFYDLKNQINELEKQIFNLKQKLEAKSAQIEKSATPETQTKTEQIPQQPPKEVKYARYFDNGTLSECDVNVAQYKLTLINPQSAKFVFCGNKEHAIAQRDAVLKDVCDYSGYNSSMKSFKTTSEGEAILENGKWKVTKKSSIKFC